MRTACAKSIIWAPSERGFCAIQEYPAPPFQLTLRRPLGCACEPGLGQRGKRSPRWLGMWARDQVLDVGSRR
eukprot:6816600-Pyramimonas_sp.AAC.1